MLRQEVFIASGISRLFDFTSVLYYQKLPALFNDSQTVNGTYKVLGLGQSSCASAFLTGLSEASGLPEEDFLEADERKCYQ